MATKEKTEIQALRIEIFLECLFITVFHKRMHYYHTQMHRLFYIRKREKNEFSFL